MVLGKLHRHMQKVKLNHFITPNTKTTLKCIKDLNVSPETTEVQEENMGNKLLDIDLGVDFFNLTPKAKLNKWDYMKLKTFCTEKATSQIGENICKSCT